MGNLYPDHCKALKNAELAPSKPPTMKKVLKLFKKSKELKDAKKEAEKKPNQTNLFLSGD